MHSEKLSLIVDDLGILCTSSDAILRDTSDRPAVKARPLMPPMLGWSTDDSGAIVTFVEGTSCGEEVAAARRHVTERFTIEADPVPKEDKGQPCDKRQSRLEHHRNRGIQPRRGPQATDRETVRTTRLKWYTRRTFQLDMRMVDLRRITSFSFSFGTLLRTPMKERSWAMMDSFQTQQHKTVRRWTHPGSSDTIDDDETRRGLVIVCLAMRSGGTIVGLFKRHQQEAQKVTTWSRARQHGITHLWSFDMDAGCWYG